MARALFLQISGALVATLCQDQALKLVRVHNSIAFTVAVCVFGMSVFHVQVPTYHAHYNGLYLDVCE